MAPQRGVCGDAGPSQGLPRAFLQSLRPLFDILDDRRRGFVHLREIESRWQRQQEGGQAGALPRGVLEGLRSAAPPSGYLTFERFVEGLRASMLSPEEGGPGRAGGCTSRSLQKVHSKGAGEAGGQKPTGQPHCQGVSKVEARRSHPRGRGQHRRHTITDGVDYGMLKQMKELEKEKDFLLQGLEMVEQARQWCHRQLHLLQERQKQLGQNKAHGDWPAEQGPSPLAQLLPRLQDLNRCLCDLLAISAKPLSPFPMSANGPPGATSSSPQQTIHMLKEQNWLLTKEVTDKSERITQLEQEKSALIKQLFEARAQNNPDPNLMDSTFI